MFKKLNFYNDNDADCSLCNKTLFFVFFLPGIFSCIKWLSGNAAAVSPRYLMGDDWVEELTSGKCTGIDTTCEDGLSKYPSKRQIRITTFKLRIGSASTYSTTFVFSKQVIWRRLT